MPDRAVSALPSRVQPVIWAGASISVLSVAAVLLWAYYGSAVFFEMIAAGFASCF
jgi:hypothetical protein